MSEKFATVTSGTGFIAGVSMASVNEWLAAASFVVGITAGLISIRKSLKNSDEK